MGEPAMQLTSAFLIFLFLLILNGGVTNGQSASTSLQALEDFSRAEPYGFPVGWRASRNESATRKAYVVGRDGQRSILRTKGVDEQMRIFKRVAWDPKEYPMVTWRWRLRAAPSSSEIWAAVFVSLDTDLLIIPVSTKYAWASAGTVGRIKEGRIFGAAEVVVRSGPQPIGQWIAESVNAYADFLKVHNHEPAPQACRMSLVAGPGLGVDSGRLAGPNQCNEAVRRGTGAGPLGAASGGGMGGFLGVQLGMVMELRKQSRESHANEPSPSEGENSR